ncbi:miaB [Acrasis kona]|uniref:MiaB n=1 Tax=Acrasis kona TaxID=1008807 RepID=A0AAW2YJ07_9EUKA
MSDDANSKKRKLEEVTNNDSEPKTPPGTPPGTFKNDEDELVSKAHYDSLIAVQEEVIQKMKKDINTIIEGYKSKITSLKKENQELKDKLKQSSK